MTDPTTPSAEQLRQDAAHYRELAASRGCVADCLTCARDHRAAAALDAEAARLEREAADALTAEAQRLGMYTPNPSETPNSSPTLAARLEREASATPHAELRGWGVTRPDGTPMDIIETSKRTAQDAAECAHPEAEHRPWFVLENRGYRAVPVRLTTEGAE